MISDQADQRRHKYWREVVARYERAHLPSSIWQIFTSVGLYLLLWPIMLVLAHWSYWLALPLTPLAAALLVRTYIIFHDCAHTSLFAHKQTNNWVGRACALLVVTPFQKWRHEHAMHHASAGDLERRGTGDVHTYTVDEYMALPWRKRFTYRAYRNPWILFVIGPVLFQVFAQRWISPKARRRNQLSVHLTTISIIVLYGTVGSFIGYWMMLSILLPILALAGTAGIWLFYVQHQFEDAYWMRSESWDYALAALQGSSHLKLPRILQWASGNIGLHHVHHLSSRIPNYRLQKCHDENELFDSVPTLTLWDGMKTMRLKLWNEHSQRLITWREYRALMRAGNVAA